MRSRSFLGLLPVGLATIAFVAGGCATAPKQFTFDPTRTIDAPFDVVWSAVVEYFAVSSLPIDTVEKAPGLIVTSWMDASGIGGAEDKKLCDCGGAGIAIQNWTRGKFNVFVKAVGVSQTQIRITCTYQQSRDLMGTVGIVNCSSTGFVEQSIQEYIVAKVHNTPPPAVPRFVPGQEG
jgi:hypothetical protein